MLIILHLDVLSRCDGLVLWSLTWRNTTGNDFDWVVRVSRIEEGDRIPIDSMRWRKNPMQCRAICIVCPATEQVPNIAHEGGGIWYNLKRAAWSVRIYFIRGHLRRSSNLLHGYRLAIHQFGLEREVSMHPSLYAPRHQ
jgi:hypothetical protein